jgi:hypothetical protein
MNKAKICTGQGHPAFSDDRIDSVEIPWCDCDDLRENLTPKLYSTRAKDVSSDDPRVDHAAKIWDGRDHHTNKYVDGGEDRVGLIKPLKREKGSDCGQWHGGVSKDGTKADFRSRRGDE